MTYNLLNEFNQFIILLDSWVVIYCPVCSFLFIVCLTWNEYKSQKDDVLWYGKTNFENVVFEMLLLTLCDLNMSIIGYSHCDLLNVGFWMCVNITLLVHLDIIVSDEDGFMLWNLTLVVAVWTNYSFCVLVCYV